MVFADETFHGMPGVAGARPGAVALSREVARGLVHAAGAVLGAASTLVAARVVSVTEAFGYVHLGEEKRAGLSHGSHIFYSHLGPSIFL